MADSRYSIGIDLGTTNCAMAYSLLEDGSGESEVFQIPQYEALGTMVESPTLPSFLYRVTDPERGRIPAGTDWLAGRFARKQAAEASGRVVHSAKSWLGHHAVDREAKFLPWRSDELPVEQRISPIQASSYLLAYLKQAWDARFPQAAFEEQQVTVTVPASFDAAAQQLTLQAARQAGFPRTVRLLEEPQAAFYRWMEAQSGSWNLPGGGHVLVVDIGGGTSDFSLFEITPGTPLPHVKRIAVSDHLLLGGDNIDLTIAHRLEPRLTKDELSAAQWSYLVARSRDLKERVMSESAGDAFSVSVPGRGSGLFAGTLTAQIQRTELDEIVLEGFYPSCGKEELPDRSQAGLREWALPYATDSAITKYIAEFLKDRPMVDAMLFNGGSLYPEVLRKRLQTQVAAWQGNAPVILENSEPDLAVARGAARFGALVFRREERIEAGAARAIYLEVQKRGTAEKTLVCVLPRGAEPEAEFETGGLGLELQMNRPVRFQPYSSTHGEDPAGALVRLQDQVRLPSLQAEAKWAGANNEDRLPISLAARMNELGLLHVACVSADPRVKRTWPLEFDLRAHLEKDESVASADPGVDPAKLLAAQGRIKKQFERHLDNRDKLSAANLLKSLEQLLGLAKSEWNGDLIRSLWSALVECEEYRATSVDHEEAWWILAGFLLRPGFGMPGDESRIDDLWRIYSSGTKFPGKRILVQQYILWRRVAGGLSRERQEAILELPKLKKNPAPELVRLAGALERVDLTARQSLVEAFLERAVELVRSQQHSAPYLVALGLLLNRAPLYAGPEAVLEAAYVQKAFELFQHADWTTPDLLEMPILFLRAARMTNDTRLDVPKGLRQKIASKLESSGVSQIKTERIKRYVPLEKVDRSGLFGEALPPGLVLAE